MDMLLRLTVLAPMFLALVLSGCSSTPKSRPEALAALARLWDADVPARAYDEYLSVEETYARAESFTEKNDDRMAEKYYRLALVKGKLLEEQIRREEVKPVRSPAAGVPKSLPADQLPGNLPEPDRQITDGPSFGVESGPAEPDRPIENQPLPGVEGAVVDSRPVGDVSRGPETDPGEADQSRRHTPPPVIKSDRIIGGEELYVVKKGDTLGLIGAKLGVSWRYLAKANNLDPKQHLYVGQELRVVNRRIVPKKVRNGLVINIPDRMMYYFKQGRLAKSIPVALGKPNPRDVQDDDVVWHTPTGVFRILAKEKDPIWRVPPSIQKEMEEQGKEVVSKVLPGDKNPLGKYALRTSIPGIMIHSTIRPASIYGFSSHGCIRVSPGMMEDLFDEIEVNTRGEIIYKPIKVAVTEDGRVFLEVNRDVYDKKIDFEKEVKEVLRKNRATGKVDWKKVDLVLRNKLGIAEDVTM
ncbi:L,D-transpeptidase family protein [Geobacter luticola]|uniref:L,D-transpeptidase family protein n=2 Tax=Geomobilimonas luticola TaxID=1114878 RepID=A0ABS5SGR9_9BACT|nr:L,D-transpeptidase family protein [Geomobilimonas luticola]